MMLCRVILGNMYEMAGTDTKAENKVLGTDYDSLLGISPSSGDLQADCIAGWTPLNLQIDISKPLKKGAKKTTMSYERKK